MVEVLATADFDRWLRRLRDREARLRILSRLDRLAHGNPGDVKPVGRGVSELRVTYGPGYRVYFVQEGGRVFVLLCGGDKSSQAADIETAHRLVGKWREGRSDGGQE